MWKSINGITNKKSKISRFNNRRKQQLESSRPRKRKNNRRQGCRNPRHARSTPSNSKEFRLATNREYPIRSRTCSQRSNLRRFIKRKKLKKSLAKITF
jgi:hypothetical protein